MKPIIYLAGPMQGLTFDKANSWRAEAALLLGDEFELLSPLRGKEFLKGDEKIKSQGYSDPTSTEKAVMTRDRWDVLRSNIILMNLVGAHTISIGTMFEAAWADLNRTPLVVVMEETGNVHDHIMVRQAGGFFATTLSEAVQIIRCMANL